MLFATLLSGTACPAAERCGPRTPQEHRSGTWRGGGYGPALASSQAGVRVHGSPRKERNNPMQVMVSTDEAGVVWIATAQGNRLTEGFFKAADETPEELERMGYPQLIQIYPAEEILVGRGIAPEELEEIFLEA